MSKGLYNVSIGQVWQSRANKQVYLCVYSEVKNKAGMWICLLSTHVVNVLPSRDIIRYFEPTFQRVDMDKLREKVNLFDPVLVVEHEDSNEESSIDKKEESEGNATNVSKNEK